MTMPSIADVKAAAENQHPQNTAKLRTGGQFDMAIKNLGEIQLLCDFALSVINAPGLSAERLAEIQNDCKLGKYSLVETAEAYFDELLAEVLRLRAGVSLPGGVWPEASTYRVPANSQHGNATLPCEGDVE